MDTEKESVRREYRGRINRVMDFIEENLSAELSLDQLASVANFSKYHFHRIFYTEMGETLFRFIQRIRVEKAALLLCSRKDKTITEIAFDVGFSGSAAFAKAFRNVYGVSATEWRRSAYRNFGKTKSNSGKVPASSTLYTGGPYRKEKDGC